MFSEEAVFEDLFTEKNGELRLKHGKFFNDVLNGEVLSEADKLTYGHVLVYTTSMYDIFDPDKLMYFYFVKSINKNIIQKRENLIISNLISILSKEELIGRYLRKNKE